MEDTFIKHDNYLNIIAAKLISDEELVKLLANSNQSKIDDPTLLLNGDDPNIYRQQGVDDIITSEKSIIFMYFGTTMFDGIKINSDEIVFDLAVHHNINNMNSKTRKNQILSRINTIISNSTELGIGRLILKSGHPIGINESFFGYRLVYSMSDFS